MPVIGFITMQCSPSTHFYWKKNISPLPPLPKKLSQYSDSSRNWTIAIRLPTISKFLYSSIHLYPLWVPSIFLVPGMAVLLLTSPPPPRVGVRLGVKLPWHDFASHYQMCKDWESVEPLTAHPHTPYIGILCYIPRHVKKNQNTSLIVQIKFE